MLAQVKKFFEAYGESRFQDLVATSDLPLRISNRAGFYRANAELEKRREYLVLPEVFKDEVCKGFEHRWAVQVLRRYGWLVPGNDDRNTQKPRLPEMGTTRVYVIGAQM